MSARNVKFMKIKKISIEYFSEKNVINFVSGFIENSFGKIEIKPSEAEIVEDSNIDFNSIELEEEENQYGAVGFELLTQLITLKLPLEEVLAKLDIELNNEFIACVLSLIQALKRSISIHTKCELSDFDISWTLSRQYLEISIFDSCEGGNGISYMVYESMISDEKNEMIEEMKRTLQKPCCNTFCSDCLLLPRTSEFHIRMGYINKNALSKWME